MHLQLTLVGCVCFFSLHINQANMYVIPELDYSQDFVKENMQAYIYDKNEKKTVVCSFIHSCNV